jgi:serine/threonine-protein kinase
MVLHISMAGFPSPQTSTAEARAFVQRRVANLGLVLACIGIAFVVMRVVVVLAVGKPERMLSTSMVTHYLGVAASIAMWAGCRWGKRSLTAVYAIELVGLVAICSLYAVMAVGIPQAFRPEMTILLAFGVFLLGHAVHVPSSWRWTALLGATLAVPLIIGAWVILTPMDPRIVAASASAAGSVQTTEGSIIGIGMASVITWWVVIASTASAASAVIYGLRHEVRQARRLGQYTLEEKLGEGGMGVVYRANHAMLRRATAVKLLLPELAGEEALARFEREVRSTARLSHPNTVTIFDYGRTSDGVVYYAMELLDGASLAEIVVLTGPMPPGRVVRILQQVAGALAEAHALGLVHRDIKPANVMLTDQGGELDVAKVVDFGLVKLALPSDEPSLTSANLFIGTPLCLAPEVIEGNEGGGGRDMYALGCVGYFLLTGVHVFEANSVVGICSLHTSATPAPPSERLGAPVPDELERLILELLAKKPGDRPDAPTLLRRLEACASCGSWSQAEAQAWWERWGPRLREGRSSNDASAKTKALPVDIWDRGPTSAPHGPPDGGVLAMGTRSSSDRAT